MSLTELPPEILRLILQHISLTTDIRNVRLTCGAFCDNIIPVIRKIIIGTPTLSLCGLKAILDMKSLTHFYLGFGAFPLAVPEDDVMQLADLPKLRYIELSSVYHIRPFIHRYRGIRKITGQNDKLSVSFHDGSFSPLIMYQANKHTLQFSGSIFDPNNEEVQRIYSLMLQIFTINTTIIFLPTTPSTIFQISSYCPRIMLFLQSSACLEHIKNRNEIESVFKLLASQNLNCIVGIDYRLLNSGLSIPNETLTNVTTLFGIIPITLLPTVVPRLPSMIDYRVSVEIFTVDQPDILRDILLKYPQIKAQLTIINREIASRDDAAKVLAVLRQNWPVLHDIGINRLTVTILTAKGQELQTSDPDLIIKTFNDLHCKIKAAWFRR